MPILSKLAVAASVPLALVTLLSPRSQGARKCLNTILYFTSMGICSIYGILLALTLWVVPGERLNIFYYVARAMHTLTSFLTGTRCVVLGRENTPTDTPFVMVGNHQSSLDILYLGAIFPKHASIMAKKELKWVPFLGQWMNLSGAVWIDRKSRKDAFATFERVGQKMHNDRLSLWIFPEGTRSKLPVPGLLPFKMGAFHLALQAGVPVVPVVCENYYPLYDDGKTRFEAGTIRVSILPPVSPDGYSKETVHAFADKVRGNMLSELHRLDADRDAQDTAGAIQVPGGAAHPDSMATAASVASTRPPPSPRDHLGGVARWMSYIVGVGPGRNVAKEVKKQTDDLHKKGLGFGEKPEDFGLMSYAEQEQVQVQAESKSTQVDPAQGKAEDAALRKPVSASTELNESGVLVDQKDVPAANANPAAQ